MHYDTLKTLNAANKQPSFYGNSEYHCTDKIIESKPQKGRKTKPFPLAILSCSLFWKGLSALSEVFFCFESVFLLTREKQTHQAFIKLKITEINAG